MLFRSRSEIAHVRSGKDGVQHLSLPLVPRSGSREEPWSKKEHAGAGWTHEHSIRSHLGMLNVHGSAYSAMEIVLLLDEDGVEHFRII